MPLRSLIESSVLSDKKVGDADFQRMQQCGIYHIIRTRQAAKFAL